MSLFGHVEMNANDVTCQIDQAEYLAVGFGTYRLTGEDCVKAVNEAISHGFTIIDTATFYYNFDGIAKALEGKERSNFYIISKVWHDQQTPPALRKDLKNTLQELQTPYLDAYLLHWPNSQVPIEDSLLTLHEFQKEGRVRHVGLSNVTAHHLKRALEVGVPITWVQVEMNPFFYDPDLLELCQKQGIGILAWAPLSRARVYKDSFLQELSSKYGKTPSQIALRWIVQHGVIPIPGSSSPAHIQENRDLDDFFLSDEEMQEIDQRAKGGKRERATVENIGFNDEFDFTYEQCWPIAK